MTNTTFPSLQAAIEAGFHFYDKTHEGYLVRKITPKGWILARVLVKEAGA